MSLFGFLLLLLIAAICGGIGQSLAGYSLGGCVVSIVVGFIGAFIGIYIAEKMDWPRFFEVSVDGKPFPIIWAIIGAAIFTFVIALLRRAFVGRS
ncbi:MAG: GlsB/YeaQ/YmgE family stress response membrane protein [Ginsengibacter sp.]